MNNLMSFDDYFKRELEMMVYDNEINEGTGIRGFFNKMMGKKISRELSDEIELSKQIMDGIKTGLESLNENFDAIKKSIEEDEGNHIKGEKQKILDSITELLEKSRKSTWDINSLIDEGEIDYTGFTANVGVMTVALFGVLFCPIRAMVIVHKGYSYFFNIVKNTIRKSLVMLQLNFDQFENLIITKSFQSMDYIQDRDAANEVSSAFGEITNMLFDKERGSMKNKRGNKDMENALRIAKEKYLAKVNMRKLEKQSSSAYNSLDMYNNTYTKSLETLRSYTQDDVAKQQDAIKNSISKLSAGDVDLQSYGEFIIAAAEEHAYKVSASIYTKFAKMTEVFSLPNQKKMVDLIQAATKEQEDLAAKERKEKAKADELERLKEMADELNETGSKIFGRVNGMTLGELDEETNKYSNVKADGWTYDELKDLSDDERSDFEKWLLIHPEVLEKCDDTLKVAVPRDSNEGYFKYIDPLIKYIKPCLIEKTNESIVLDFETFCLFEAESSSSKPKDDEKKKDDEKDEKSDDAPKDEKDEKDEKSEDDDSKDDEDDDKNKFYLNMNKAKDNLSNIKSLFVNKREHAEIALEVIGNKILEDKTFTENAKKIVSKIKESLKDLSNLKTGGKLDSLEISKSLYDIINGAIDKLKEERNHDFPSLQNKTTENKEEKKSED